MNRMAMNNSLWTTNSQSFSNFEFSHFCRYFPILFDSCTHSLLIVSCDFPLEEVHCTSMLSLKGGSSQLMNAKLMPQECLNALLNHLKWQKMSYLDLQNVEIMNKKVILCLIGRQLTFSIR